MGSNPSSRTNIFPGVQRQGVCRSGWLGRNRAGRAYRLIFRGSLLVRLFLLVAAATAPALLVMLFIQQDMKAAGNRHAGNEALRQAHTVETDLASINNSAHDIVSSLGISRSVLTRTPSCTEKVEQLAGIIPLVGMIAVLDADGQPYCATSRFVGPGTLSQIRQDTAGVGDDYAFHIGSYLRTGNTSNDMLLYFQRFHAATGDFTVALGLRLSWLNQHFALWDRIPDSRIIIADRKGAILVRVPDDGNRIGLSLLPESIALQAKGGSGVSVVHDPTGEMRLVGYEAQPGLRSSTFVQITVSSNLMTQDFYSTERRGFVVLALGALVAIVATMIAGQRLIRRPARALMEAARSWARGDLASRVYVADNDHSEFGRISRALNDMAAAMQRQVSARLELQANLEGRVAERTRELLQSRDRLQVALGEQAKSEASLRQAQKMQMVGQLAGGIAHDFNNLLTALIGALDMLRPRLPSTDERSVRLLDNAMQSAERGARLTSQLLSFSRRQRLTPVATDLNQIVDGMMELLRTTIGRDIRVRTELQHDLCSALVDPNQLEAAILNLALNARDAMPKGGVLSLCTSSLRIIEPQQAQDGSTEIAAGDYVSVVVHDTGTGMLPEVLGRVFEPFFSTKPPSKGSGLGLSQVHGLAAQSGGAVRIVSKIGAGTSVSLIMPAVRDAAIAQPRAAATHGSGGSVMVVDDDSGVRALIGDMLTELGYRPLLMSDPLAALDQFVQGKQIDMLLADYAMPGMNGADLIARALLLHSNMATVLATGHADLPTLARGVADAELAKPFTLDTLIKTLEAAQRRRVARMRVERESV